MGSWVGVPPCTHGGDFPTIVNLTPHKYILVYGVLGIQGANQIVPHGLGLTLIDFLGSGISMSYMGYNSSLLEIWKY